MPLLILILNFLSIGLFTIGGGLVAIPLIHEFIIKNGWFSGSQFITMIAISQSTPGSIGVNVSTFVGVSQFGIIGGIVTSLAFITPSVVIITLLSRFGDGIYGDVRIEPIFSAIRPTTVGIIASVAMSLFLVTFPYFSINGFVGKYNWLEIGLFLTALGFSYFSKISPVIIIIISAVIAALIF